MSTQRVFLELYDPRWAEEFAQESSVVTSAMGNLVVAIHHIGSTAIPGIHAKPIIDILVAVSAVSLLDERVPLLEALGYEAMGEFGITVAATSEKTTTMATEPTKSTLSKPAHLRFSGTWRSAIS